jgi:hypothetical protein
MSIFFFQFETTPSDGDRDFGHVGGAFVNCWIKAATQAKAEETARQIINEHQWHVEKLMDMCPVDRDSYEEDDPGLQYYEQALTDDEVFEFHVYPREDKPEAD